MNHLDHFQDIIAEERRRAGLTQESLARLIGITPQAISKWENGVGYPDVTLFPLIAKALNIPISRLFGEVEQVPVPTEAPKLPQTYGGLALCHAGKRNVCYSNKSIGRIDEEAGIIAFSDGSEADLNLFTVKNCGPGEVRIYECGEIMPEMVGEILSAMSLGQDFDIVSNLHISTAHTCNVAVTSDGYRGQCRVEAKGTPKFIASLKVETSGDTLTVDAENHHGQSDHSSDNYITIHTGVERLARVKCDICGCSDITIEPQMGELGARINGAGVITAPLADQADLNINGSGDITVKEVTSKASIKINGSGDVTLERAASAEMRINGSGDITCREVSGQVSATVNGSGEITCGGDADKLTLSINGSGDFHGEKLTVTDADIHTGNDSSAEITVGRIRGMSTEKLSKETVLKVLKRG